MSYFDDGQLRREVNELDRLAMDARVEGQYATAERLLEQAVASAQRLQELPLLVEERYWLASAQRMQSKYRQALATYTWLIGLASDPSASAQVADDESLWYLAGAFMDFVECGRFLPEMPVEQLLRVVSDGLAWLERVGKSGWSAGLRSQRGSLLKNQERREEARQELEVALALARRHPEAPGYTLATHQLELADLLHQMRAYTEAVALAEEVLAASTSSRFAHYRANKTLAFARLGLQEYPAALTAARDCVSLTLSMEDPSAVSSAYEVLGRVQRETGHVTEAMQSAAQYWRWSRRDGTIEHSYFAMAACVRVRLAQVRQASRLPLQGSLPEHLPADADQQLALRLLASARRFVERARPLARQLDRATGTRTFGDELDGLAREAEQLAALLEQEES